MLKAFTILISVSLFSLPVSARSDSHPHYAFVLPNGYVGWIQVIFNDPHASQLRWEQNSYRIDVPDSGIARTSDIRVEDPRAIDRFSYLVDLAGGRTSLHPIPKDFVLPGFSHGGFGYADTDSKGPGYSWFIFVGPPQLRAKVPLADWDKVVEEYRRTHNGNSRVELHGSLPVPGKMASFSK